MVNKQWIQAARCEIRTYRWSIGGMVSFTLEGCQSNTRIFQNTVRGEECADNTAVGLF